MAMQAMLERFGLIETAADVGDLIATLREAKPPILASSDVDADVLAACEVEGSRCHVCSGVLVPGEAVVEYFGTTGESLLAHQGCHLVRRDFSPAAIWFCMKIGFWSMMRIQMEECASWRHAMATQWAEECGSEIGLIVSAPHVPGWSWDSKIESPDELVRFTRHLYLFEREKPKWEYQNRLVPTWDESISWKEYKRNTFMPAYRTLKRLNERKTLRPAQEVLARTGGHCALCGGDILTGKDGGKLRLAKDHIHPFSKGGSDDITNLQPLHHACNGAITSVGPGEIPLSLQLGRWIISTAATERRNAQAFQPNRVLEVGGWVIESSGQHESRKPANQWIDKLLATYATHLRGTRAASARRRHNNR
jgi:5-methylcytosine-specific restriction endonuclease McrA